MTVATTLEVPVLNGYHAEWRSLREHSHNVLIEGTVADTETVLRLLRPYLQEPIVWREPSAPFDLPSDRTRTLIVRDAGTLSADEQRQLLVWMDDTALRPQVISTTTHSLYALVGDGRFDADLYYRLNVLLLQVAVPCDPASPDGAAS